MSGTYNYSPFYGILYYRYWSAGSTNVFYGPIGKEIMLRQVLGDSGSIIQFYLEPGYSLPPELSLDTDYYVRNMAVGGSSFSLSLTPSGPLISIASDPGANKTHFGFLGKQLNLGDACFKPKLLADQKKRAFPKAPTMYKKPPAANEILDDYVYDAVTGLLVPNSGEVSGVF